MDLNLSGTDVIGKFKQLDYRDLIIFLIPFVIFTVYLYVFNPGLMSFDSFNQMHQIATGKFTNNHPFFHTFIEMLCISVYPSPASYCVFQICVFSVMWMVICKYFRKTKKHFLLQVLVTLVISLIPLNGLYSITLWKDVLFSYFLMFTCFLVKVLLDRDRAGYGFIVVMSIVMACTAQLRHNGTIVILIFLAVLAIYYYRKDKKQKLHIKIPALTIVFILMIASLNVMYDVDDNQKDALAAKVVHILSDYDLYLDLSDEDSAKIHNLISEKNIKTYYNKTYSDPVYNHFNHTEYDKNKMDYIFLAMKCSVFHPIHFMKYLLKSAPMVWDITRDSDWGGIIYKTDNDKSKENFYRQKNTTAAAGYDNATVKNSGKGFYEKMNSFAYDFKDNYITQTLFLSPALYMYLSIILVVAIHLITKSKTIYLVYLPNMINIVLVFLSTPIQDVRYLYPSFLICYLLIIALIGSKRKADDEIGETESI